MSKVPYFISFSDIVKGYEDEQSIKRYLEKQRISELDVIEVAENE